MVLTTDLSEWSLPGCPTTRLSVTCGFNHSLFLLSHVVFTTAFPEWSLLGCSITRLYVTCGFNHSRFLWHMWFLPQTLKTLKNGLCLVARLRVFVCCLWLKRQPIWNGTKMVARRRESVCCHLWFSCGFHHSICRMVFAWLPRLRVFVCCLWMKRLGMDARPSHVVFTTAFAEWSLLGARLRLFACCLVARRETVTCGFHHSICCPTTRFYLLLVVEAKARLESLREFVSCIRESVSSATCGY